MEVSVCPSGLRRITYKIPSLVTVCRGTFEKCYAISDTKIKVLLKKMDAEGVSLQQDTRGRHQNQATKLFPEAWQAVTDHISSYKASESHYRRATTEKKYFESNVSTRKMWRDFCKNHPCLKTKRSKIKNKGPLIKTLSLKRGKGENWSDDGMLLIFWTIVKDM